MKTSRLVQVAVAASLAAALSIAAHAAEAAKAPGKAKPPAVHATKLALPFLDDDYTKVLAEARTRKLPIFIEAWAPW